MRIKIEIPAVDACEATQCAYNGDGRCHARAITIGDGAHPACDTFFPAEAHASSDAPGGVAACKITACRYNEDLACGASAIQVGRHEGHADCVTFSPR